MCMVNVSLIAYHSSDYVQNESRALETDTSISVFLVLPNMTLYFMFITILTHVSFALSSVKRRTEELLVFYSKRTIRISLDTAGYWIARVFFNDNFHRKLGQLPPIKNSILLQPAHVLVKKIKAGEVKSEDVVRAYIERAKEVQPFINAIIQSKYDVAIASAQEVDRRVREELEGGSRDGQPSIHEQPLLGVPFSAKDSVAISDMYLTAGITDRKGFRSREDSEVVRLLRNAGAIPIVLTNVPEACTWFDSVNQIFGRTCNPYDLSRIPGGSSGGEGALIAAAGSLVGVGSDLGGSIRMPAFFCGVFGHKTSPGIVSLDGVYPIVKPEINALGPICRYASDLKPMLRVMAGDNVSKLKLDEEVDIKKLNVFYSTSIDIPLLTRVEPKISEVIEKAVEHLKTKAKDVRLIQLELIKQADNILPALWNETEPTPATKTMTSLGQDELNVKWEFALWLLRQSRHTLGPLMFAALEKSFPAKGSEWQTRYAELGKELKKELLALLGDNGVLIFPTHPEAAPKHNTTVFKGANIMYTWIWNVLGFCSTAVPMGLNDEGLPVGFQVIAAPFNDHLTIAVANELEKEFGGWTSPSEVRAL